MINEQHKRQKNNTQIIYTKKPEITDGKSNGSCHSEWETSEKISCDLRGCNFSTLFSLLS